jgi:hypothetical protein
MALIEVRIALESTLVDVTPEVRAWVDLSPDGGLGSERELPLQRDGAHEWIGAFVVRDSLDFLYRVGLLAHPGARWSLCLRHRGSNRELLSDCDTLPLAKSWLVGSCRVASAGRGSAWGSRA